LCLFASVCLSSNAAHMASHTDSMHGVDSMDLVVVDGVDSMDLVVDGVDLNELPWQKLPYQSLRDLLMPQTPIRQNIDPPVLTALRVMQAHDTQGSENGFLLGRRQIVLFNNRKYIAEPELPQASQALVAAVYQSTDKLWLEKEQAQAVRHAKKKACYKIVSFFRKAKRNREIREAIEAARIKQEEEAQAAWIAKEMALKKKAKDALAKKDNLRRLLHNIHTRQYESVLFESNVQRFRELLASDAEVRKFSWTFCCRKMADVDRLFHAEHLSKWCWIVTFIVENTTTLEDNMSLRILEYFVQARTECQSEQKSFKQIQRKISKINQCLQWMHETFPAVANGYVDCCTKMLQYACTHQPLFHQQALVLAHFLQRSDECHDHAVEIILGAFKGTNKEAAIVCSAWLLKHFPSLWPKLKLIADKIDEKTQKKTHN